MANLFIIGNGFDIAHGLETSYDDFRNYLVENFENINMDELVIPNEINLPDGGIDYNEDEVLTLLFYLISGAEDNIDEWKDVENSLGHLDFDEVFDMIDVVYDKEGDIHGWHTADNNQQLASSLIVPTTAIQRYFSKWVEDLDVSAAEQLKNFNSIVNVEDLFLTFNYTDTLEEIYDIKEESVCHIHGRENEEIFFGHGNDLDKTDRHMTKNIGSEDGLNEIQRQLRKRTDIALENQSDFFEKLEETFIDKIYSIGFSFSAVDTVYLDEICRSVDTENVVWYFNDYKLDAKKRLQYEKLLIECGFKGEFSKIHIGK